MSVMQRMEENSCKRYERSCRKVTDDVWEESDSMKTGKASQAILDRSVLRPLTLAHAAGAQAAFGEDCAFLPEDSGKAEMACATVGGTLCGPFDRTPAMLVESIGNNLAAAEADPEYLMVDLFYPSDREEAGLKELMGQLAESCRKQEISVIGGHTEIVRSLDRPMAALTGFGRLKKNAEKPVGEENLVLAGWIGLAGTAILASSRRERLLERYPVSIVDTAARFGAFTSVREAARAGSHFGVSAMHDVSQGGIFGALWELAERAGAGLEVDLKKIPVRQETIEICEFFDVNPYQLYGQGALLLCTEKGDALVSRLKDEGIAAAVIGRTTGGNDRIIRNGEETRFLDRPAQDELWRLAEAYGR